MFTVRLSNFGWDVGEFLSFKDAIRRAEDVGFECVIFRDDEVVGSFSPVIGVKEFHSSEGETFV